MTITKLKELIYVDPKLVSTKIIDLQKNTERNSKLYGKTDGKYR